MGRLLSLLRYARKAAAAVVGGLVQLLAVVTLPSPWQEVAVAIVAVATAIGVYRIPNQPPVLTVPLYEPSFTPPLTPPTTHNYQ